MVDIRRVSVSTQTRCTRNTNTQTAVLNEDIRSRLSICRGRKGLFLISLASTNFLIFMSLSILGSFFPSEALSRNISNTASSWIFGVFSLVQFITSPIFGRLALHTGTEFLFLIGQFVGGVCTILFGILNYVNNNKTFIILCVTVRIFLALGCAANTTANLMLASETWSEKITTVIGIMETSAAFGYMVGPALGGVLYEFGGFLLPFAILGGLMLLGIPLNFFLLKKEIVYASHADKNTINSSINWRNFRFFVISLEIIGASMMWCIIDPILEPRLKELFNMKSSIVGLVFLLTSSSYAISAPIFGHFIDGKPKMSIPFLMMGFLGGGFALLLLAPSKWLGLEDLKHLWLCLVSLIILGLSASMATIPTFAILIKSIKGSVPKESAHAFAASSWSSLFALGEFIGPVLAGLLVDKIGFSDCLNYLSIVPFSLFLLCLILFRPKLRSFERLLIPKSYPEYLEYENDEIRSILENGPRNDYAAINNNSCSNT